LLFQLRFEGWVSLKQEADYWKEMRWELVVKKVARLEAMINPIGDDCRQILEPQSSALEGTYIGILLNISRLTTSPDGAQRDLHLAEPLKCSCQDSI
jgi:hypothetical protein